MSDYSKITDFLSKDSLPLNDPAKYVKGSEIDAEYNAIAVAVATKADTASPTLTTPTMSSPTITGTITAAIANFSGLVTAALGLTVSGAAFNSRGITDNATAKALTLSGSGANSVTIANSATNPTIGTSAGSLAISSQYSFFGTGVANYIQLQGNTTTNSVGVLASGSDTDIGLRVASKGSYSIILSTNESVPQVAITHTASANRYITLTGSSGGNPTIGTSAGSLGIAVPITCDGGIQAKSATATPAGGTVGFFMGSDSVGIYWGSGAPTVSAAKGALYLRTDGSATNNRMYVNTDGVTTWTAVTTAA